VRRNLITVSKEDYLKAVLEAEGEGLSVISATLAHWLNVSAPAVTHGAAPIKKRQLVRVSKDGRVQLTASGQKIAQRTINRHHLIERMLAEVFGMEMVQGCTMRRNAWNTPSLPTSRQSWRKNLDWEGPARTVIFQSPRPRRHGADAGSALGGSATGPCLRLGSIYERDRKLLEFLEQRGLRPGTHVRILATNYDQTVTVKAAAGPISVGKPVADRVWVAELAKPKIGQLRLTAVEHFR